VLDNDAGIPAADLAAAFEAALRAGVDAAVATFRAELDRRGRDSASAGEHVLRRYEAGSWKHDVLELALALAERKPSREFRFSDLAEFQEWLGERHPRQRSIMSGVSVTLQGLVKDGVLHQVARGLYRAV
jgi:hypothetical protein